MQSLRDKGENRENLYFSTQKNMLSSSLAFHWINNKEDIIVFFELGMSRVKLKVTRN